MAQSCDRAVFEDGELAVILGDGVTARLCALCLHALCGTVAVICYVRRSRARFVLPFGNFYQITESDQPMLLLEELCHISFLGKSSLLFLMAKKQRYDKLLEQIREDVESRFIISDLRGMLSDKIV